MDTKKIKKTANQKIAEAKNKGAKLEKATMQELKKVQKQMEETSKKVSAYIKKNPEKASLLSAGIGAALGTITALFISRRSKGSKDKK
ncbi:MAG TPA: hypothetical protein ENL05_01540 [Candidatus Moranbacteria bacterium]|nr:hypothetical protein [Candidatus Moranbacteria bacterium]